MSSLTDFLHKLVDKAGISELHSEIDDLDKPAEKPEETTSEDGTEVTPNAAE